MALAQQDEIVRVGRPAVCPVLDVVGLQPPSSFTPTKPAVPVAVVKLPHEPRWNAPRAAADPDRPPVLLHHPLQAGIAGQTPDRLFGQRNTGVGLGDARLATVAYRVLCR